MFMMTFLGMPLFYLELAIGQYASLGAITVWRLSPMFKGLQFGLCSLNSMDNHIMFRVVEMFEVRKPE